MRRWQAWAWLDFVLLVYIWYFITPLFHSYPPQFAIIGFPLLSQPDAITCGPTSATMLLRYYKRNVNIEEVNRKSKTTWFTYRGKPVGAMFPQSMQSVLNLYGLKSKLTNGNLKELKYYISQNRPPAVLLRSGEKLLHWVIAIGYDETNLIIADPGDGTRYKIPTEKFLGAWNFTADMDGVYYGKDFYHFLIVVADEQSNTFVVPKHPPN